MFENRFITEPNETKQRILSAAFELFGRFGFEGTSIREIAKQSDVNVAAINYHFKNKDTLFWEIMAHTYRKCDQDIQILISGSTSVENAVGMIYDYFCSESLAVRNTMKMMLTEGMVPPQSEEALAALNNPMGPPGGQHLGQVIQNEVSYPLNRDGLLWAVKSIFGATFHWSMMVCSGRLCHSVDGQVDPLMANAQIRIDVLRMVGATMNYLKSEQKKFSAGM
jgi:AcrR family transcriptional regulator